nr:response regulator transcription factor [Paenibacillus guangzhouensis]
MRKLRQPRVLVIEDDEYIRDLLSLYLDKHQFDYDMAETGNEGVELFLANPPDIVLLDIMLPEMDGFEVCREIRRYNNVPILMITGKGESYDKLKGFELGADDYIVKPFDPKELIARIKAVLRRTQAGLVQEIIQYPGLTIRMDENKLVLNHAEYMLPPKEMELLHRLAIHPNKVFTREQLLYQVWGHDYAGDFRTVDVHIKRLREKLGETEQWRIVTIWGVGYKFEVTI